MRETTTITTTKSKCVLLSNFKTFFNSLNFNREKKILYIYFFFKYILGFEKMTESIYIVYCINHKLADLKKKTKCKQNKN